MNNNKLLTWVLKIGVAGEFIGHGTLALQGKAQFVGYIIKLTGADTALATQLLFWIGVSDILVALLVLAANIRIVYLWAAFWGFWTALVRPLAGDAFLDFVERWANWSAPLALLIITGWPKDAKSWFNLSRSETQAVNL